MNYKEYKQKKAKVNICIYLHKHLNDWSNSTSPFKLQWDRYDMERSRLAKVMIENSLYGAGIRQFSCRII